jgi:sterol 14-demethylase
MEQVLLTLTGAAGSFSPFQLAALLGAFALVSMFVARVLSSKFPGSKPPVFEGAPFVGGLMKFAGVRRARMLPDNDLTEACNCLS